MSGLVPARFEIDAQSADDVFHGFHDPTCHWNGFACPTFTRDEAERLTEWVTFHEGGTEYHSFIWSGDTLLYVEADDDRTHVTRMDGPLYPIGAWTWTWMELDDDAPHDVDALDDWLTARDARHAAFASAWNRALQEAYARGATAAEAVEAAKRATAATPLITDSKETQ